MSMTFPLKSITDHALDTLRRNTGLFGDRFPTVGQGITYTLTSNDNWLAAFWPGLLWLAYSASNDDMFKEHAESLLPSFRHRLDAQIHITHDLGFLYTLSARAQWQLTHDDAAHQLVLRAAAMLADRYRAAGRYIQAWGPVGDPDEGGRIIVDTLMNVPLLLWAAEQTGNSRYRQIACDHLDISAEYLVRADASTAHTFFFDQETGHPLGAKTHQGYADESMWARGQAWAIFGFAVAAQWTGNNAYRDLAQRAAARFMDELPADQIPRWDLRLPPDAPQHPDTSASSIAASGMLRLADQVDALARDRLRAQAEKLLAALHASYVETRPDAQGLLRGGTYHAHKGYGVNEYFICGDYFLLEAVLMLHDACPDFWGPPSA